MTEKNRSLELEVVVDGTVEEVWRAVATGPGISSWYVPHTVEERAGGHAVARFGAGPEMEVPGRVATWEPPHRIVFDGGADVGGFAFEWTVTPVDGHPRSCAVKLINSGFDIGPDGDAMYDAMTAGWKMFLFNLQLHCRHFGGQVATASLPTVGWSGNKDEIWDELSSALGAPASPSVGDRLVLRASDDVSLAGEVVDILPARVSLLLDEPAPGTAFVAVEGTGDQFSVSVWSYLYGANGEAVAARDEPRWQEWLSNLAAE